MIFKNNMRPAMEGVGNPNVDRTRRDAHVMFNTGAGEAADFGNFADDMEREAPPRRQSAAPNGRKNNSKKKNALIIAICAAVAVIILAVIIVFAVISGNSNITAKDNAYMSFIDGGGSYQVISNGTVIDHKFEGEVELVVAADKSFAYVFDNAPDGILMYILDGKKLNPILTKNVSEIVATAELEPGIVYKEGDRYKIYSAKNGEDTITKDNKNPENFLISADASTVVYTITETDTDNRNLYVYIDGDPEKISSTTCTPIKISSNGDYVYVSQKNNDHKQMLYVIDMDDDAKKYEVSGSEGFLGISQMNIAGDEVIFFTGSGIDSLADIVGNKSYEINSYLYRYNESEDEATIKLGKNIFRVENIDKSIVLNRTFADTYLVSTGLDLLDGITNSTYHLNKKYELSKISSHSGKFDAKGDYFYYTNDEGTLYQMDLGDENRDTYRIDEDVIDFAITEKGNVYSLNTNNELRFFKVSTRKKDKVTFDAVAMSFYDYSNKLYFSELENESVFVSEESTEKDVTKFGSTFITGVPIFSDVDSKKCYAYTYDSDNGWSIFYTSSGNRFSQVNVDCSEIVGVEIPDFAN